MTTKISSFLFRSVLAAVLCVSFQGSVAPQQEQAPALQSISYRLGMSHPNNHLFEVSIEVETGQDFAGGSIDFQMPKWSPGRYAVFDFAKNVQEFHGFSGICPR